MRPALGLIAMMALLGGPWGLRAATPATPLGETVLFAFDDYSLPFNRGLLLTLDPGRKSAVNHGTGFDPELPNKSVLSPGQPGDPDYPRLYFYGTVLHIDGQYHMWYTGWDQDKLRQVCYAVSKDGFHWEKPKLGLVDYHGSRENNLVAIDGGKPMMGASAWVLHEPDDPNPNRRFKMVREVDPSHIMAAFSPDGLTWTSMSNESVVQGSGLEPSGLIKFNGCYYLNGHGGPVPHPLPKAKKRMMVTFASYDFEHWTRAGHISFRRDNVPPRLPSSFYGHEGEQVHVGASLWHRGNVVLGFYGQYHNDTDDRRTSTCDLGLVVSNDAIHFKEPIPDFKMVPAYEDEEGAEARLIQGQAFENIGDRTVLYYSIWEEAKLDGPFGVRVATWPRDQLGYFSQARDAKDAHCISRPIELTQASRVYVNTAGLAAESRLKVELTDEQFRPLPGYSGDDCVVLTKSGLRQLVSWKGKDSFGAANTTVRVRINWEGAKPEAAQLFAIYVAPAAN